MESREKYAARTTIVGGQPPGNARDLPPIPVGVEELLALAAANEAFAEALVSRREEAIEASGVRLTPTEQQILLAMSETPLDQMIAQVRDQLGEPDRRSFLEQATAAVAVLVGGAALAGCADKKKDAGKKSPPAQPMQTDPPKEMQPDRPKDPGPPAGSRPDRPRPKASKPDAGAPRPMKPRPTRGSRPDRPRPDRRPKTTGISIDRRKPRNPYHTGGRTGSRPKD